MRECAYAHLICPSPLVGGLDLMTPAMFFLRLSWQPSPWWGRDGGARAGASFEVGLPLCLVSVTALSGEGLIPSCWSRRLEGCMRAGSVPFFFFLRFICLFFAVLGLHCCVQAFSSCGEQGLLFIAVLGPLIAVAFLVAEHML